jgi:uncharacterized membrane protein YraQ (UPF0718 family)
MFAYVLVHNEYFLVQPKAPVWEHYQPFKWWLLPHGLAAACALVLGPLQFSDRLRRRFTKLHRVVGRLYIAGVFIGVPLGVYIQYFLERNGETRSFTIAAAVDAFLLMTTTGIALACIPGRSSNTAQGMIRSDAVALVFLEVRVILGVTGLENLSGKFDETVVWACVGLSLLLADIVLQLQELRRARPMAAGAQAR